MAQPEEPGKLLLVSDLEGCAPTSVSKRAQSQLLCKPEFFSAIASFLEGPKNKVAFLGDYFDQGPYVVDSINSIMGLKKTYGPRVHIILGNRDLNKFRLVYEMNAKPQTVGEKKWVVWSKFYNELPTPLGERLKHIVTNSMGAPYPVNLVPGDELSQEEAAYLFVRSFSEPAASQLPNAAAAKAKIEGIPKFIEFIQNVRALYQEGKIVTYDEDFKTLLSHAGGADPFLLHNLDYYTSIKTQLLSKGATYYDKLEQVRLSLQEPPTQTQQATHFYDYIYNAPLSCIPSLFDDVAEPREDYFLLQGLGLKPNPGKHFVSFVQSCDIQSCKGPQSRDLPLDPELTAEIYAQYLRMLETSGINVIAFGHAPHCVPIPVIYKRTESNILFVGNDTSNGYRPAAIEAVNQIPLAYVSYTGNTKTPVAGVFSLPGTAKYTYDGGSLLAPMIGTWQPETAPRFLMDPPRIQYNDGRALTFPARTETAVPGIFKPAKLEGGRRTLRKKTINRRKSRRYSTH